MIDNNTRKQPWNSCSSWWQAVSMKLTRNTSACKVSTTILTVLQGPALKKAMIASHIQFPSKQFKVKNVLGDGKLVAAHSYIVLCPGEPGV